MEEIRIFFRTLFLLSALAPLSLVLWAAWQQNLRSFLFGFVGAAAYLAVFLLGRTFGNSPSEIAATAGLPDAVWNFQDVTPLTLLSIIVLLPAMSLSLVAIPVVPGFPRRFTAILLMALAGVVAGLALALPLLFGTWMSIGVNRIGFFVPIAAAHVTLRALALVMTGDEPSLGLRGLLWSDGWLLAAALFRVDTDDNSDYTMIAALSYALTGYWPEIPDFLLPQFYLGFLLGPLMFFAQDHVILIPVAIMWFRQLQAISSNNLWST